MKRCIYCGKEFVNGEELVKHVKQSEWGELFRQRTIEGKPLDNYMRSVIAAIERYEWRAFDDNFQMKQLKKIMRRNKSKKE